MIKKFQYFVQFSRLVCLHKIEKIQDYNHFFKILSLQYHVRLRKCSTFNKIPGYRKIFYIREKIFFKLIMQLTFWLLKLGICLSWKGSSFCFWKKKFCQKKSWNGFTWKSCIWQLYFVLFMHTFFKFRLFELSVMRFFSFLITYKEDIDL